MKKAWEIAIAPAKSLPMQAIGQYMAGNSLQIFSIFMVYTLFKTPISAIITLPAVFARFDTPGTRQRGLLLVKIVYVLCNLLVLGLGVWKVGKMGLLPTTRSDWLAWETARDSIETAWPEFGTLS
jgi:ER membrane protein complex subunit 4